MSIFSNGINNTVYYSLLCIVIQINQLTKNFKIMETKKHIFLAEQVIFILLVNLLIFFYDGYASAKSMSPTLLFALSFFHAGTFSSIYLTLTTKCFNKQIEEALSQLNIFYYFSFVSIMLAHNCSIHSQDFVSMYVLTTILLFITCMFLVDALRSFKNIYANAAIQNAVNPTKETFN